MPYIFPKRYLRSGDVMDPEDLNQDFTPAQELLDGHIDSVNLDAASFKSGVTVAAGAYYEPYYKSVEHDVGFASTGSPRSVSSPNFVEMDGTTKRTHYPTDDDGSVFVVPNDGSWVAVPGKDVDNSLMIEPTTGSSVLWVTAYVQYVWQGFFEPKFSDSGSTITSESLSSSCSSTSSGIVSRDEGGDSDPKSFFVLMAQIAIKTTLCADKEI